MKLYNSEIDMRQDLRKINKIINIFLKEERQKIISNGPNCENREDFLEVSDEISVPEQDIHNNNSNNNDGGNGRLETSGKRIYYKSEAEKLFLNTPPKFVKIDADGDCLYKCFCNPYDGKFDHMDLRSAVSNEFMENGLSPMRISKLNYGNLIKESGFFGCEIELDIISKLLNTVIIIVDETKIINVCGETGESFYILQYKDFHYNLYSFKLESTQINIVKAESNPTPDFLEAKICLCCCKDISFLSLREKIAHYSHCVHDSEYASNILRDNENSNNIAKRFSESKSDFNFDLNDNKLIEIYFTYNFPKSCKKGKASSLFKLYNPTNEDIFKTRKSLLQAISDKDMIFHDDIILTNPEFLNRLNDEKIQEMKGENFRIFNEFKILSRQGIYPPVTIKRNKLEGYIIIADKLIERNTLICEYAGEVISWSDSLVRNDLMTIVESKPPLVICPSRFSNISRFISGVKKSSNSNLHSIRFQIDNFPHVLLFARRNIKAGEKLRYNYNGELLEFPVEDFVD